jgi:hypothetical protein
VYAVGIGVAFHFDGDAWSNANVASTTFEFHGVYGTSSSDVWVVGNDNDRISDHYSGEIFHYDGSHWSKMYSNRNLSLSGAWTGTAGQVWVAATGSAAGVVGSGFALFGDVNGWIPLATPDPSPVIQTWGAAPNDVWVTGNQGIFRYGVTP